MNCHVKPVRWRAQLAAAAAGGRGLDATDRLRAVLLDQLPYSQTLAALDPAVDRIGPAQVRLLDGLAALDAGEHGQVYRWVWRHCLWPFDWRLPAEASTRALTPAFIRAGLQRVGSRLEVAEIGALTGVRVRDLGHLRGHRLALTVRPGELGLEVYHGR